VQIPFAFFFLLKLLAGSQQVPMHLDEIRSKAQTKKELWILLAHDVEAYLPEAENCSV